MRLLRFASWSLLTVVAQLGLVAGQTPAFIKVLDTETSAPLLAKFSSFSRPSLSNGMVCFTGRAGSYQAILHSNARSFTKLADTDTEVPGSKGTFTSFGAGLSQSSGPSFSGLRGAFSGSGDNIAQGIYIGLGGPAPSKVVALGDPVPGGSQTFRAFSDPALSFDPVTERGEVVFAGITSTFFPGIYSIGVGNNAASSVIADTSTAASGKGETLIGFGIPAAEEGITAFVGHSQSGSAVYRAAGGALGVVADTSTPIPGGTGEFVRFGAGNDVVAVGDGNIVFVGDGPGGQKGYYAQIGGALQVVADLRTPVPGGSGTFTSFLDVPASIDGSHVAFVGNSGARPGIYLKTKGKLVKVVASGDTLDGKTVNGLDLGPQALEGKFLAFRVLFTGGGQAIYLAAFDLADQPRSDLNGDNIVDFRDVTAVLRAFGPCPSTGACPEDINGDGVVNTEDVLEVYGNRGAIGDSPVNDECQGAIDLGVFSEGGRQAAVVSFSTEGATSSNTILLAPAAGGRYADWLGLDCDEGSGLGFHNDIWFRFGASCSLDITTCGSAEFDTRLALYRGDPLACDSMEPVGCNDDAPGCANGSNLTIVDDSISRGREYYLRVGSKSPSVSGRGKLVVGCATSIHPPHPNFLKPLRGFDECRGEVWTAPGLVYEEILPDGRIGAHIFSFEALYATEATGADECAEAVTADTWVCLTAPCTGPMSARVNTDGQGVRPPRGQQASVSVFSSYGTTRTMLSCTGGQITGGREITTYWGAVTGNPYLVRLTTDAPGTDPDEHFEKLSLNVRCWDDDSCGWPYTGPCEADNSPIPGCDNGSCCTLICQDDPYCCNIEWDSVCASKAISLCDLSQPLCEDIQSEDSCYLARVVTPGTPNDTLIGCRDSSCCETVCQTDPACCENVWDQDCAERAALLCAAPTCPVQSDFPCDIISEDPGCDDPSCCGKVCDAIPECCSLEWNLLCKNLAESLCGG